MPPIRPDDVAARLAASRSALDALQLQLIVQRRKTREIARRLRELEARRVQGR